MSGCLGIKYLPDDMVRTALGYPTAKHHRSNKTKVGAESLKKSEPLYYNSLLDSNIKKYREKPSVKKHLHYQGCTSRHGSVYPTPLELIEATRVERLDKQRKSALMQQIEKRERQLVRLNQQAKCDSVIFTKFGVFEKRGDILPNLAGGASSKGKKKKSQALPSITKVSTLFTLFLVYKRGVMRQCWCFSARARFPSFFQVSKTGLVASISRALVT